MNIHEEENNSGLQKKNDQYLHFSFQLFAYLKIALDILKQNRNNDEQMNSKKTISNRNELAFNIIFSPT